MYSSLTAVSSAAVVSVPSTPKQTTKASVEGGAYGSAQNTPIKATDGTVAVAASTSAGAGGATAQAQAEMWTGDALDERRWFGQHFAALFLKRYAAFPSLCCVLYAASDVMCDGM